MEAPADGRQTLWASGSAHGRGGGGGTGVVGTEDGGSSSGDLTARWCSWGKVPQRGHVEKVEETKREGISELRLGNLASQGRYIL